MTTIYLSALLKDDEASTQLSDSTERRNTDNSRASETQPPAGQPSFWSFAYYQSFFDIDTNEVNRLNVYF